MNSFADVLREKIEYGDSSFSILHKKVVYFFTRIMQDCFDTILYGYVEAGEMTFIPRMSAFGVVVNGKFYVTDRSRFLPIYDVDKPLSAENKRFFGNRLEDVSDIFKHNLLIDLRLYYEDFDENTVPLDDEVKAKIREAIDISEFIAEKREPEFEISSYVYKDEVVDKNAAAIRYLLYGEDEVKNTVDAIVADKNHGSFCAEMYYKYLVQKRLYDERMKNLSSDELATQSINKALEDAVALNAQSVRIFVKGKNSLLDKWYAEKHPNFSIDGQEIVIKVHPGVRFDLRGLASYHFAIVSPTVKDDYSLRNAGFLGRVPSSAVEKIVYGKKVLYSVA